MKPWSFLRSKAQSIIVLSLVTSGLLMVVVLCVVIYLWAQDRSHTETIQYGQSLLANADDEFYGLTTANWSILHAPTPPPRKPQVIPPWEPHRMVMISVSLDRLLRDENLFRNYEKFLELVLPMKRVMVLYHRKDRRKIPTFIDLIEHNPIIGPMLERLEFLPCESDSMWIRDFGPVFGQNRNGQFLVYDFAYVDPRVQVTNHLILDSLNDSKEKDVRRRDEFNRLESLRGCEITPTIFASHLQAGEDIPTLLARPPLIIAGGDFIIVDNKTVLVSKLTLEINGGRTDYFEEVLKRYLGIEKVIYLQALPGETIEHLDFVVQVFGPDTILVASPEEFDPLGRIDNELLKRDITKILRKNRDTLRKEFPNHRIIDVPMPPPIFESAEDVRAGFTREIIERVAAGLNLSESDILSMKDNNPADWEIPPKVMDRVFMDTGVLNLKSTESMERIIAYYRQRPVADLMRTYASPYTYYRTYINSLQVIGDDGQEYIIIPKYRGRTQEEQRTFFSLEKKVELAYRSARPDANLKWLDCSDIITRFGAVHCMAMTMPEPPQE